jgi:hypothetical protein
MRVERLAQPRLDLVGIAAGGQLDHVRILSPRKSCFYEQDGLSAATGNGLVDDRQRSKVALDAGRKDAPCLSEDVRPGTCATTTHRLRLELDRVVILFEVFERRQALAAEDGRIRSDRRGATHPVLLLLAVPGNSPDDHNGNIGTGSSRLDRKEILTAA